MLFSPAAVWANEPNNEQVEESRNDPDPQILTLGWRVQLESLNFENQAARYADSVQVLVPAQIHILFRDGNYKVQAGDFLERDSAEVFRQKLTARGFENTWIVKARVVTGERDSSRINFNIPQAWDEETEIDDLGDDDLAETELAKQPSADTYQYIDMQSGNLDYGKGNGYRVQIMTLYEMPKDYVERLAKNAQIQIVLATYVYHTTQAFVVRMGDFLNRNSAENALTRIRNLGYPDAFIVRCNVNQVQ